MVKTFNAPLWVPILAASVHFSNLLAIGFSDHVRRSDKMSYIIRPNLIAYGLILLLLPIQPTMSMIFGCTVLLSHLARSPLNSALASLLRSVYPPTIRSSTLAIMMSATMLLVALCSLAIGWLLEQSELWVGPIYATAGLVGLVGVVRFRKLRQSKLAVVATRSDPRMKRSSLAEQFSVFKRDSGFLFYEAAYMFFGGGNIAMMTAFPFFLDHEFQASHQQATSAITFIPMFLGSVMLPLWGSMIDRHNPLLMRGSFNLVWSFVPLIYFITPSMHWVYVAVCMMGLVQGGSILIWQLGVNYFAQHHEVSNYMGLHQMLTGVRGVTMPFVSMALVNLLGPRQTMPIWGAMMLTGTTLMFVEIFREWRRGQLHTFQQREIMLLEQSEAEEASRNSANGTNKSAAS